MESWLEHTKKEKPLNLNITPGIVMKVLWILLFDTKYSTMLFRD